MRLLGSAARGVGRSVRGSTRLAYGPAKSVRHPGHRFVAHVLTTIFLGWVIYSGAEWIMHKVDHLFNGSGKNHHLNTHLPHHFDLLPWLILGLAILAATVVLAEYGHRRANTKRAEAGRLAEPGRSHRVTSGVWLVAVALAAAVPTGMGGLSGSWRLGLCLGVLTVGWGRAWVVGRGDSASGEAAWRTSARLAVRQDWVAAGVVTVVGLGLAIAFSELRIFGGDALLVAGLGFLTWRRGPHAKAQSDELARWQAAFAAAAGAEHVERVRLVPTAGAPSGAVGTLKRDQLAPAVARAADVLRTTYGAEWVVRHDGVARTISVRPEAAIATSAPMPVSVDTDWHVLPLGVTRGDRVISHDVLVDPHCLVAGKTGSGKTVAITTLATHALLRGWEMVLVEVAKGGVDFRPLRPWCREFATELDPAAETLEAVVAEVRRRRDLLDQHQVVKVIDLPADVRPAPMLVVVDEAFSLLAPSASKTAEAMKINAVKDRIADAIGRLAREARFASVHVIFGMQRPDADTFRGEIKANTGTRILCGHADDIVRRMCLRDPTTAPVVGRGAKGRAVIESETEDAQEVQVYYCPADQLPDILEVAGVPKAEHLIPAPKAPLDLSEALGATTPTFPTPGRKRTSRAKQAPSPAPSGPTEGAPVGSVAVTVAADGSYRSAPAVPAGRDGDASTGLAGPKRGGGKPPRPKLRLPPLPD